MSSDPPVNDSPADGQPWNSGRAPGTFAAPATAPAPGQVPWTQASPGPRSDVNARLTRRRQGRVTENDEYAAFARRVIRAWARRVAAGDIDAVCDMAAAAHELDDALRDAVTGLHGKGYSWAEIATRLGVTRQAAQQRWGASRDSRRYRFRGRVEGL